MTKCDKCGQEAGNLFCGHCRADILKRHSLVPLLFYDLEKQGYRAGCSCIECPANEHGICITAEPNRNIDVEMLKEELARNENAITSLQSRNVDIATRMITLIHGISVGDIVSTPGGKDEYVVKEIDIGRWWYNTKHGERFLPWLIVNPHTNDGTGWDTEREINLYANWRKKV